MRFNVLVLVPTVVALASYVQGHYNEFDARDTREIQSLLRRSEIMEELAEISTRDLIDELSSRLEARSLPFGKNADAITCGAGQFGARSHDGLNILAHPEYSRGTSLSTSPSLVDPPTLFDSTTHTRYFRVRWRLCKAKGDATGKKVQVVVGIEGEVDVEVAEVGEGVAEPQRVHVPAP
ncbi:hypothetical protein D9611_012875 [Ephemerocybe angulata]|uniref:Uncharacterized protein n=1 Tax=Ephemerocybe angulata TaxID=980116 RepID=A0A8H5BAP7_9AGAR|nr:hypothetical protein D9611_012875 [Tulosesus angulatus]